VREGIAPLRVLFLCSRNRRRSPTAERLFSGQPGLEVASAGLATDANEVVTPDLLQWADVIFVMEPSHRSQLQRKFGAHVRGARVVCLQIRDLYGFMDAGLTWLLEARVSPHLRRGTVRRSGVTRSGD
jgi:predicted protein tyrosine phosphatase